jgi:hypothetical protein
MLHLNWGAPQVRSRLPRRFVVVVGLYDDDDVVVSDEVWHVASPLLSLVDLHPLAALRRFMLVFIHNSQYEDVQAKTSGFSLLASNTSEASGAGASIGTDPSHLLIFHPPHAAFQIQKGMSLVSGALNVKRRIFAENWPSRRGGLPTSFWNFRLLSMPLKEMS